MHGVFLFFSHQFLILIGERERIDHFVEVALHKILKTVEREVDSVVGYPPLREIVGANPLAPVPRSDEALAVGGIRALRLRCKMVVELCL